MALALGRRRRRRGAVQIQHRDLDRRVENPQRLIVRDMLLRLAAFDEGQSEVGGVGHDVVRMLGMLVPGNQVHGSGDIAHRQLQSIDLEKAGL